MIDDLRMESYRDSFRAQSGLDPIHYVTLPGAAWDAMLRHLARKFPIHLITDERAYQDVRASIMGGLSCIFQPYARANNPELGEDYVPAQPSYLDFNAMYPAAMTHPMPKGPCEPVALPESGAERLRWLHGSCLAGLDWEADDEAECYRLPARGPRLLGLGAAGPHEGGARHVRAAHGGHGG